MQKSFLLYKLHYRKKTFAKPIFRVSTERKFLKTFFRNLKIMIWKRKGHVKLQRHFHHCFIIPFCNYFHKLDRSIWIKVQIYTHTTTHACERSRITRNASKKQCLSLSFCQELIHFLCIAENNIALILTM